MLVQGLVGPGAFRGQRDGCGVEVLREPRTRAHGHGSVPVPCGGTSIVAELGVIVTPDGAVMLTFTFCGLPVALLAPTVNVWN